MRVRSVDEGGDHRVVRHSGRHPAFELALPLVESRTALVRSKVGAGPVDDLVGAPDEAVERVDRGAPLFR